MPNKKKKFNSRFPPARIKKIMQTDEEVGKVAAAVPVLISKALEHFIQALLVKASQQTLEKNAKTLTTSHIKQCIYREKVFDFLKDLVVDIPDLENAKDHDTPSYSERNSQPKKHTSGRGKKRKGQPLPSTHSFSEEESLDNNDDEEDEEEDDEEEEDDDDEEENSLERCPTNNAQSGIQADNSTTNNAQSGIQADNSTTNNVSGIQSDNHTYSKGALTESKLTQDTDQPGPSSAAPKTMIPPKNILMDLSYPVLMGQYTPRKGSTEQKQEDDEDYDT